MKYRMPTAPEVFEPEYHSVDDEFAGALRSHSPVPPENLLVVRDLLIGELALASASFTGRRVACVIETESGLFGGHNVEHGPANFTHAEEVANARKMETDQDSPIERVYLTGDGQHKIKHISPCSECFDALVTTFTAKTEIVLFEPNTQDSYVVLDSAKQQAAYSPKPYSALTGSTLFETEQELIDKTPLTDEDRGFVAQLRRVGIMEGISFYLTGSASGRGGVSNVIKYGYDDLDLIAVSERETAYVMALFESLAEAYYGELERVPTSVRVWFIDEVRRGTHYSNGVKDLDLVVARTLRDGMVRMDYFRKNFFHQIS